MNLAASAVRPSFLYLHVVLLCSAIVVHDSPAQYFAVRTDNLCLVYLDEQQRYIVPHTVRCFENSLQFHRKFFNYTPTEQVLVLLQDFSDYGYAGATTLPYNFMTVGIESFEYVYETSPTNERMNWVMSHELTHVVASDKAAGADRFFRSLFGGKVMPTAENPLSMAYTYLTNPRRYSPRWYHEGFAVFMETWMSGGIGRTLGGYDEMAFRAMVRDSSSFFDFVGLESEGTTTDFQVGQNAYLYGTRFMSYLSQKFGPEQLVRWIDRTEDSHADFTAQFSKVYGSDIDDEWTRWIEFERNWQRRNLDSVRTTPLTFLRPIIDASVGSVSRSHYDVATQTLYAAVNFPGEFAHIEAIHIPSGSRRTICDVLTPALYYVTSLAYDPEDRQLFFTTQNSWLWRDLNVVDIGTGETRELLKDIRTGDLVYSKADQALWGVQHNNGYTIIVRIPKPFTDWQAVKVLDYGKDIYDIDISPDGRWLSASMIEISGRVTLVRMDVQRLLAGSASVEELHEFELNSALNFVFSPDGSTLYGTSYYTGVSNVYAFDLDRRTMEILTNVESGLFRPIAYEADSLIAWRYTASGFTPVAFRASAREDVPAISYLGQETVEKHPVVTTWLLGSPMKINYDSVKVSEEMYGGFSDVRLGSIYPVVEGFKNTVAGGLRLNAGDQLGLHRIDLTASYSPTLHLAASERLHAIARYRSQGWGFTATYNRADFYDLFGPTKVSRKGYSLGITYKDVIFNDPPSSMDYAIALAGYGGLERLPDYQNVAASFDRFYTSSARMSYKRVRKTLGGIEPEQGISWEVQGRGNLVRSTFFPRAVATLDAGTLLPISHSSIWLRLASGISRGERSEPFANFYLGGFGNNWVDYADVKRYRNYESFPGVSLNEIRGTNFAKATVEWTLPPVRFRRFGFPALYCTWAHAGLFASVVGTNVDDVPAQTTYGTVGGQVDMKIVSFSRLDMTISFGYARAAQRHARATEEWMVSLKIL